MLSKTCTKCLTLKAFEDFKNDPKMNDGRGSWCKACALESARKWRSTTKGKIQTRKNNLRAKYGISLDVYNDMFSSQIGCCAICAVHQSDSFKTFVVDHDHGDGSVRGLLCQDCNLGLGWFRDSSEVLERALQYLNKPNLKLLKVGE